MTRDDPERTTPIGLLRYASEYLDAAIIVDDAEGEKPGYEIFAPVVVQYLIGHSIELSLKAFLLARGISLKELRVKYGHQLRELLDLACRHGLDEQVTLSSQERDAVLVLDDLYSSKELEYIVTGAKRFPVHGPLESAAIRILRGVAVAIGYPVTRIKHAV